MKDLYSVDLSNAAWATFCGGNTGDSGTGESCVEFTDIPGFEGAKALRDTKLGAASPELRFTAQELKDFAASL